MRRLRIFDAARTPGAWRARSTRGSVIRGSWGVGLLVVAVFGRDPLAGQVRLQDLVVTVGVSADWHQGNFSAVTVPRIDSTESVASGAGHAQLIGNLTLLNGNRRGAFVRFDGILQQFATGGFEFRNYAPRVHTGNVTAYYREQVGSGTLALSATAASTGVNDRPPLPLYLPPGYEKYAGAATYSREVLGARATAGVSAENADYAAVLPQLDLLDHSVFRAWATATPWAWERSSIDLFSEYSYFSYNRQGGSGTANDPFRTDHMYRAGAIWRLDHEDRGLRGAFTADGTVNRSNSRRVEYDLLRISLWGSTSLGENVLFLEGQIAAKRYLVPFMHALVPGEEADNSSYVAARLTREFGPTLNGSVRVRWTRAETSIGGAYFRRLGASFSLNFRPFL